MKGYRVRREGFEFRAKYHGFYDFDHTGWARTKGYFYGIDAMFHGSPDAEYSANGERNGDCLALIVDGYDPRTGIDGTRYIHYPKEKAPSALYGSSYAVAAADSGIGLFLQMGKDKSGVPHFLQRKRVYGGSPNLMEVYNHFQIAPDMCLPFAGDNNIMDVRSKQSINSLELPEGTQFQTKMGFTLQRVNNAAVRVEYSCNTGKQGIYSGSTYGRVWSDPNQSGHTVVSGTLGKKGVDTKVKGQSWSIWTSLANKTVDDVSSARPFRFEVTWDNFIETLKYSAIKSLRAPEEMFGRGWDSPENWQLKIAKYGIEFHNPEDLDAHIGGMMKYFYITGT